MQEVYEKITTVSDNLKQFATEGKGNMPVILRQSQKPGCSIIHENQMKEGASGLLRLNPRHLILPVLVRHLEVDKHERLIYIL